MTLLGVFFCLPAKLFKFDFAGHLEERYWAKIGHLLHCLIFNRHR